MDALAKEGHEVAITPRHSTARGVRARRLGTLGAAILAAGLLAAAGSFFPSPAHGTFGAAAIAAEDWVQYRFDAAHTSSNPSERLLGVGNLQRLRRAWSVPLGGVPAEPAVTADSLYVSSKGGVVRALSPATGTLLWAVKLDEAVNISAPVVSDSAIYVARDGGSLTALARSGGHTLWTQRYSDLSGGFAPPVASGPVVYAAGTDTVAFDAITGKELWRRRIGCFSCSPAIAGRHALHRLGSRLWQSPVRAQH